MKTIWKFTLGPGKTALELPLGAKILSTMVQRGEVCLWALVDTEVMKVTRIFHTAGTGHELPDRAVEWTHHGSVQLADGSLIVHIFEDVRS